MSGQMRDEDVPVENVGLVRACACGVDWTEKNGMAGALISFLKRARRSFSFHTTRAGEETFFFK